MVNRYIPSQGDIVLIDFSTQVGHEQKGKRYALVVSNETFHQKTKMGIVCPITTSDKNYPTHIRLDERTGTKGSILCEHVKSIDIYTRGISYKETAPYDIVDEVIDIICSFID